MKKPTHTQCILQKDDGTTQVSWIPSQHAVLGHYVKLKENGEWIDGWKIISFSDTKIDSDVIQERERDFKNHRNATDI